jgi:hypothetical protein
MDTTSAATDSGEWVFRQISTAGKRLFWRLNGPLETAIHVAPSEYSEPSDVMEPYFGPDGSPHPVSQASLLEPPASSVTVRIQCIDNLERDWASEHWLCGEGPVNDEYPRRLGPRPDDKRPNPRMYVVECCGEKRPWFYDTCLQVAAQGEFLTVHEYISAVHPWLMGMRDTILDALEKAPGMKEGRPNRPPEDKLAVVYLGPGPLRIDHEDEWEWWHRKPPVQPPEVEQVTAEERHRKAIERAMARSAARIRALQEEAARAAEMEKEK